MSSIDTEIIRIREILNNGFIMVSDDLNGMHGDFREISESMYSVATAIDRLRESLEAKAK
jgi:hypothetical protein